MSILNKYALLRSKQKRIFFISLGSLLVLISLPFVVLFSKEQTDFFGHASGASIIEPESGVVHGDVSVVTDANASNGQYVKFNGTGFVHPGTLLNKKQLDFVKAKIAASQNPWFSAYNSVKGNSLTSPSYVAHPVAYVGCGAYSNPDEGCSDEMKDAIAAYSDALVYYYSGNVAYAQKSIEIMNAWSALLIDHKYDTTTYVNGPLQSAWAGLVFARTGEIIRYTSTSWAPADVTRFENMLKTAFLPHVITSYDGGNVGTTLDDATIDIAVFTNDRTSFDKGIADWKKRIPAVSYMSTDNPLNYPNLANQPYPYPPPDTIYDTVKITQANMTKIWHYPTRFVSGLEGETCRDFGHMSMGLDAAVDAAETARIQGIDLYGSEQNRLVTAYETNARWGLSAYANMSADGLNGTVTEPDWVCPTTTLNTQGSSGYKLGYVLAYNHFHNRLGIPMPYTKQIIDKGTPTTAGLFRDWETLTHGDTGNADTQ